MSAHELPSALTQYLQRWDVILSVITICDFCLASIPYKARVASIRMSRATVEVSTTPIGVLSASPGLLQ